MQVVINQIEYTDVHLISQGQEGQLYTAKSQNEIVVLKKSSLQAKELLILENLKSKPPKNFAKIIDFDRKAYIVMEKGDGTLTGLLLSQDYKQLKLLQKLKLFEQIVNGICELHARKLIHRDLKPDNILFFKQSDKIVLKLIDTGQIDQIDDRIQFLTENAGTLNYQAPEYFSQKVQYNEKVDVWSLGLIFYQMLTNHDLIVKKKQILDQQYINQQIESIKNCDEIIQELIRSMLDSSKDKRWSAKQVKFEIQKIIQNIELKEDHQIVQQKIKDLQIQCETLVNLNQQFKNQIQNQTRLNDELEQKYMLCIQNFNEQKVVQQNLKNEIENVEKKNTNYKLQISQVEQQLLQLMDRDKQNSEIIIYLKDKIISLEQNLINKINNNKKNIGQLIQPNNTFFKHQKILLFGLPGAGKTWIFSTLQGLIQKPIDKSTTKFQEFFITDHNITIIDSPAFQDEQDHDISNETFKNYNSYFCENQIDNIVLVVQYQRFDLMKSQIKHCLKYFKDISGVIVINFHEPILEKEEIQLKSSLQFCKTIIYSIHKNITNQELMVIFQEIKKSCHQTNNDFKNIFRQFQDD
ncbi:unnamed protein product [Paramecium sonneborni]|uniref:Protein kinase domain-containing protein n=1 Tax=Paramecium sonneborni TaxID=65129 RepID=A0A8S1NNG1_9CILI|nr:unnamed protein product [Paramecium sonneborni]